MKKTNLITKILAFALVLCLAVPMFASCGSNETVMTMEIDGKTYTIGEKEFSLLMTIKKLDYFCSIPWPNSLDVESTWTSTLEEGGTETFETYYKNMIVDQTKAFLVEQYLAEKYNLSLTKEDLDNNKAYKDYAVKSGIDPYRGYNQGVGTGRYKSYYGYSADSFYDVYMPMLQRSADIYEYLFGEEGIMKVTDEQLSEYYENNYLGYQYIMIDLENKVVRDENGDRVRETTTTKDEDGKEVIEETDSYKTEKLTDDEKSEKQTLAATILKELEAGTATFEELIEKYSDEFLSVEYSEGLFAHKDGTFLTTEVDEAAKELEIGEYTDEAVSVSSNTKQYIVKRIELKEEVYNDEHYAELFENYESSVSEIKYEEYIETFFDKIVVDEAIAGKYTMADTFLSDFANVNFQYYYSGYTS